MSCPRCRATMLHEHGEWTCLHCGMFTPPMDPQREAELKRTHKAERRGARGLMKALRDGYKVEE